MSKTFSFYALVEGAIFYIAQDGDIVSAMQTLERTDTKDRRGVNLCSENYPNLLVGNRLAAYRPFKEGDRDPTKVSGENWGPQSPLLIALFATPEGALEAFNSGDTHSRPDWNESTRQVTRLLGTNCDRVFILTDKKTGLLTELSLAA